MRTELTAPGQTDEIYKLIADASDDGIVLVDVQGRLIFANGAVARWLGADPATRFQAAAPDWLDPDDAARARADWGRVLNGEKVLVVYRARQPGGSWRWLEVSGVAGAVPRSPAHLELVSRRDRGGTAAPP